MAAWQRKLARFPFRQRWLARLLFGIEFGAVGDEDYYFDLVTPALLSRARRIIPREATVLDLGTGAHAILGLSVGKAVGARVVSADIDPALAELARQAVARNGADIPVRVSRFFDGLGDERFDFVLFNPPYVTGAAARAMHLPQERRSQWDGGEGGLDVIRGVLAALEQRPAPTCLLLGVNRWFVPADAILAEIATLPGLRHGKVWHSRILPADVHLIEASAG